MQEIKQLELQTLRQMLTAYARPQTKMLPLQLITTK